MMERLRFFSLSRLILIGSVFLCYSNLFTEADYMVIPALNHEFPLVSPLTYQLPQLDSFNEAVPTLPVWTPARTVEKQFQKQSSKIQQHYGTPNQIEANHFQNYGPPVIEAPIPTSAQYGNPTPTVNYGPPVTSVQSPTYGPPKPEPSLIYGAPKIVEPVSVSSPTYGPPKPASLAIAYGAPKVVKPLAKYGPPKSEPVKPVYKAPIVAEPPVPVPSSSYGIPKPEPSAAYGTPGKVTAVPSTEYGVAPYSYLEDNENDIDDHPPGIGLGLSHAALDPHPVLGSPLVAELRERIKHLELNPYYTTDMMLARYLESTNLSIWKAQILLERTARWRQTNQVDYKLDWVPAEILAKSFPYECSGITDEGLPVIYVPVGKWDFKAVRQAGLGREISRYLTRMLEDIRNSTVGRKNPKTGAPVDQVVVIENLDGFSLTNFLTFRHNQVKIAMRYLRNLDRHYPFLAKRYLVVRTPLIMQAAWLGYRKTTPRLRKIMRVYNRFSFKGPDDLMHNVPKHALPVELGGNYVSVVSGDTVPLYGYGEPIW